MKAKAPNIKAYRNKLDRQVERYFETHVKPYLVSLLNTAQAKTRHTLAFSEGMGTQSFDVDGDSDHKISRILYYDNKRSRAYQLLEARFPELITFMDAVQEVLDDDGLNYCIGELTPTVPPKGRTQNTPIDDGVIVLPGAGWQGSALTRDPGKDPAHNPGSAQVGFFDPRFPPDA